MRTSTAVAAFLNAFADTLLYWAFRVFKFAPFAVDIKLAPSLFIPPTNSSVLLFNTSAFDFIAAPTFGGVFVFGVEFEFAGFSWVVFVSTGCVVEGMG